MNRGAIGMEAAFRKSIILMFFFFFTLPPLLKLKKNYRHNNT